MIGIEDVIEEYEHLLFSLALLYHSLYLKANTNIGYAFEALSAFLIKPNDLMDFKIRQDKAIDKKKRL